MQNFNSGNLFLAVLLEIEFVHTFFKIVMNYLKSKLLEPFFFNKSDTCFIW